MTAIIPLPQRDLQPANEAAMFSRLIDRVVAGVKSPHTERAYRRQLGEFVQWFARWRTEAPGRAFNREAMQAWQRDMVRTNAGSSSVVQARAAIRKMAEEACEDGLIDDAGLTSILRVKYQADAGIRSGNWLTHDQLRALVGTPDAGTIHGIRDRAILAVLGGAGLRRSELAGMDVKHLQQRGARWLIIDIRGKRGKVRTVPIDDTVARYVQAWMSAAGITIGAVFRTIHQRTGEIGDRMSAQSVYDLVMKHAAAAGFENIRPHDLRRTWAQIQKEQKAPDDQIQRRLGHDSIETTQRYLNSKLDIDDERCLVSL
jgi:site-specific recombinase XerD